MIARIRLLLAALAAFGLIAACGERIAPVAGRGASGAVFPAMPLTNLADGAVLLPEALRGKTLVINFWATWCEPCRKEMPSLQRLHARADPAKLAVLGVSVDTDLNLAREFLLQYQLTFANYSDAGQTLTRGALGIQAFPATLLVAPDGSIKARITGVRDWDSADTQHMIEQALALPRPLAPQ